MNCSYVTSGFVALILFFSLNSNAVTIEEGLSDLSNTLYKSDFKEVNLAGHAKANDVKIKFKIPVSWIAKEGDRPSVVQKFSSGTSKDMLNLIVTINALPLEITNTPSFTDGFDNSIGEIAVNFVPKDAKIISSESTTIDSKKAQLIDFYQQTSVGGVKVVMSSSSVIFFVGKNLVNIMFNAGSPDPDFAPIKMKYFKKIFTKILLSVVIENNWRQSNSTKTEYDDLTTKEVSNLPDQKENSEPQKPTYNLGWRFSVYCIFALFLMFLAFIVRFYLVKTSLKTYSLNITAAFLTFFALAMGAGLGFNLINYLIGVCIYIVLKKILATNLRLSEMVSVLKLPQMNFTRKIMAENVRKPLTTMGRFTIVAIGLSILLPLTTYIVYYFKSVESQEFVTLALSRTNDARIECFDKKDEWACSRVEEYQKFFDDGIKKRDLYRANMFYSLKALFTIPSLIYIIWILICWVRFGEINLNFRNKH